MSTILFVVRFCFEIKKKNSCPLFNYCNQFLIVVRFSFLFFSCITCNCFEFDLCFFCQFWFNDKNFLIDTLLLRLINTNYMESKLMHLKYSYVIICTTTICTLKILHDLRKFVVHDRVLWYWILSIIVFFTKYPDRKFLQVIVIY